MLKFILDLQKDRFVVDFALIRTVRGNFAVSREKIKNYNSSRALMADANQKNFAANDGPHMMNACQASSEI